MIKRLLDWAGLNTYLSVWILQQTQWRKLMARVEDIRKNGTLIRYVRVVVDSSGSNSAVFK